MNNILLLDQNTSYNLGSGTSVIRRNIRTNKFGFRIISIIWKVLWGNLANEIKISDSLNIFKHKINPIQDGLFRGCSRMGEGAFLARLPKICHAYPAMMKPGKVISYLRKIQKNI